MIRSRGIGAALTVLKGLAAKLGKPFAGFAAETFNTALSHRNGPYAVKVILSPAKPAPSEGRDYAEDIRARVAGGPLTYEMYLHYFTEDVAPMVHVGRLTLTKTGVPVEALAFDPWGGLEAHRPLGEVMRARKSAYHLSAKARAAV
jgi:hypothetical protein